MRDPSLHARRAGPRLPHQRRQLYLDADGRLRQRYAYGTARHRKRQRFAEDIDSTFDYAVQGDLRAVTHFLSKATVHSVINVLANTDITYSPGLVISPVSNYCAGATFVIPATTQTVVLTGTIPGPTTVTQRPAATGTILAVHESLTTAAGTFSTVKYKSTQSASSTVAYSYGWYDIVTGALVRQQEFGPSDNLVQTLDLTSIH